MKRTITLLACVLAFSISLMAQMPQDPTYGLTPNAKSFQRYGDIPVSLYTGTPNITIPLDTIRDVSLTLPISLSYHSGGVKADEHPGWVGLGWSLMLGGVITREVRDLPDETDYIQKRGFYYMHNILNNSAVIGDNTDAAIAYINANYIHLNRYDSEPDKFNFQFDGYSGFFILDPSGQWQVYSNRPIKVKSVSIGSYPIINNVRPKVTSSVFKTFTLVTDDGIEYTFGNEAIDYSINFRHQSTLGWTASAWHLERITHPNGSSISFAYTRSDYVASMSYCDEIRSISSSEWLSYSSSSAYQGTLMSPVYLKSIKGITFSLILHNSRSQELNYEKKHYEELIRNENDSPIFLAYDNQYNMDSLINKVKWYKLDSISFINEKSNIYKHIKFDYINNALTRLALTECRICNRFGITEESYRFQYRNLYGMPRYLANQTDHWGYYNDNENSSSNPDTHKPNANTLMYGTLEEITYPYGGKTIFEFEPHTYSKITHYREFGDMVNVDEAIAGGVRIRRILNIPNDSTPAWSREFRYVYDYGKKNTDNISSGILEGYPTYSKYTTFGGIEIAEGSSVSLSHIINSSGLHIGYPEAVELHNDGGYEIHCFTSCLDAAYRDVAPIISSESPRFVQISSMSHYRGYPLWDKYYTNKGKLIKSSEYTYDRVSSETMSVPGVFCGIISSNDVIVLKHSVYKTFIFNLVQVKNKECDYGISDNDTFCRVSYRKFNGFGQIKSDSIVTSVQNDVTLYSYVWENTPEFKDRFYMQQISDIIRKRENKTIDIKRYTHSLHNNIPYISAIQQTAGNLTRQLYSCSMVNDKGESVVVAYADKVPVVYLWGNDYIHPRAVIKGCGKEVIESALGFSPDKAPDYSFSLSDRLAVLRESMPMSEITEYSYTPHIGIKSIISPSGRTQYYNYDTFGRLVTIADTRNELITGYDYSSFVSMTSVDATSQIISYLDKNIYIIGPGVIYPDCSSYFWAEIEDLGLPYRWSIEGEPDAVSMSTLGKYIILKANDSMTSPVSLRLTIFDKNGNEIWSRSHTFGQRKYYFNLELELFSATSELSQVKMTVTGVNPEIVVPDLTVLVNGKFVGNISRISGNNTPLATGIITIPRDYNNDIYQINIKTLKQEDSWVYSTDELFSSPSQQ
ncbi:hypothetical protein [Muribaculum intestinale]|uniref:hypothetical protein n=1 Tax=Muribaculum intestinale TaxID=1796646 RepID=UPI0025AA1B78|nr:hypothetical protein [Muribaculum intestinale]